MTAVAEERQFDWRRGGATAGALIATLVLLGMVLLVALSNQARDAALEQERRSYDVMLLTRTVDATTSRAEAALGRFVLDELPRKSGAIYADQWRLAAHQISQLEALVRANPEQRDRIDELRGLFNQRGAQLAAAARAAAAKQGQGGTGIYYQTSKDPDTGPGPDLRRKLNEIADAERAALRRSMARTELFSAQADRLTDYLSWLGVIVGFGAIFLGLGGIL